MPEMKAAGLKPHNKGAATSIAAKSEALTVMAGPGHRPPASKAQPEAGER
jgi:hypothetical protein